MKSPEGFRKVVVAYLVLTGIGANILILFSLYMFYDMSRSDDQGVYQVVNKLLHKVENSYPSLAVFIPDPADESLAAGRFDDLFPAIDSWHGKGAIASWKGVRQRYSTSGHPLKLAPAEIGAGISKNLHFGSIKHVADVPGLLTAVEHASPGDVILLAPGTYKIRLKYVDISRPGTATAPIYLRADKLGEVRLKMDSLEGLYVNAPYWVFENLDIQGVCQNHGDCEHAFHVVGEGAATVIRNNRLYDFNAMIKVNGLNINGQRFFPDHGLVENNSFYNTAVRNTGAPVTPIDIVAADGWVVRGNLIADFVKGRGDNISYAGFMKGASSDGVFEENLVICEMNLPVSNDVRLGLSFGGGGTNQSSCRDGSCIAEHSHGIIRNNIIMHCSKDVGIYLNKARDTRIINNTLYNTLGIDVRFKQSSAHIANNILTGRIKARDGGVFEAKANLVVRGRDKFRDWFAFPDQADYSLRHGDSILGKGIIASDAGDDFCGHKRQPGPVDLGAIQYSQDSNCSVRGLY